MLLDCSTVAAETARSLAAAARQRGLAMLDAPVSGGVLGAAQGTLTIMVGGTSENLDKVRSYLEILGKNIVHAGGAGCGQVSKICNNMILGVSMIAVSEAFNLAKSQGLSPEKLLMSNEVSFGEFSINSIRPTKALQGPFGGVLSSFHVLGRRMMRST